MYAPFLSLSLDISKSIYYIACGLWFIWTTDNIYCYLVSLFNSSSYVLLLISRWYINDSVTQASHMCSVACV